MILSRTELSTAAHLCCSPCGLGLETHSFLSSFLQLLRGDTSQAHIHQCRTVCHTVCQKLSEHKKPADPVKLSQSGCCMLSYALSYNSPYPLGGSASGPGCAVPEALSIRQASSALGCHKTPKPKQEHQELTYDGLVVGATSDFVMRVWCNRTTRPDHCLS